MSEYTDQRDALYAIVGGITDIGQVHNRPRFSDALERWRYVVDGVAQIRGWEIGLEEPVTTIRREQNFRHRHRRWRIQGYVSVIDYEDPDDTDASYHAANDLALSVADAIDADRDLSGSCTFTMDPATVTEPEALYLPAGKGALCWAVAVMVTAVTIVTP